MRADRLGRPSAQFNRELSYAVALGSSLVSDECPGK